MTTKVTAGRIEMHKQVEDLTSVKADEIGYTFLYYRKQKKWTQKDLSREIGVSQSLVSKIEAGRLIPTVTVWFTFCQSVGNSPEVVLRPEFEIGASRTSARARRRFRPT